ncbi:hypothetical protein K461DRAFT_321134 [Myriangium duriaei CBS 260.36]|uniref:Mitochondrial carrier n=1 Tax=Myriangium duriaei CBS 260.36 TaxID=1168546 RepID=A0A9P4J109_9PEZI|nr:hypothetical protein K461DRAFT_321134 [Myriangium duriaei CBS 260.36]
MTSDYAGFQSMATSRDTPNPLRPYYVPPSIGITPDRPSANTTPTAPTSTLGLGRSARDLLSDLDYTNPLTDRDGPGIAEMGRKLLDQALWKYTSVLLAQPFDVAKTILQVRMAEEEDYGPDSVIRPRQSTRLTELHNSDSESDSDSPSYFTPTRPARQQDVSPSRRRRSRGRQMDHASRSESTTPVPPRPHPAHQLRIRQPDSILEALGAVWTQSGATGLWKATNATFLYNVLVRALESWIRSMLSALANLPDPSAAGGGPAELVASAMGGVDVADSTSPLASLVVAVTAAAAAGLVLAPLDLVRTRLIITPTTLPPRATLQLLRSLPSLFTPTSLLPITLLHSTLPALLTSSTPLLLRSHLHIDPLTTPTYYSIATFLASASELLLKLPLETVLRRAQVSTLQSQHRRALSSRSSRTALEPELRTVVLPGAYKGVFGTVYSIVFEEGHRRPGIPPVSLPGSRFATPVAQRIGRGIGVTPTVTPSGTGTGTPTVEERRKRGQGLSGLVRGWRVGMWGLCGVWLAAAMSSGQGGEF